MTATRLTILLPCITLLTGCMCSEHPLYIEGETVFREELVGEYEILLHDGAPSIWKVESIDDEAYRVSVPNGDKVETYLLHLVELDGQLYVDLVFQEEDSVETPARHAIARLRFEDGVPISTRVENQWLDSYLTEHPDELSVTWRDGSVMSITAETEDLQQFVIAHTDDGLFNDEIGSFSWDRHDP